MAAPIFQTYAPEYAAAGLTVFPVGGEDGKVPLVPYWPKFGPRSHARFLEKFANDNIGMVDGRGVTRVDIDDPDLIGSAIQRFGDTPIKVRTPRGGLHLWYKFNGERRQRGFEGTKIDILGLGGFGVAPPSVHPNGNAYSFLEGGLGDIGRLPRIKPGAVTSHGKKAGTGRRNDYIYKVAGQRALSADNEGEVLNYILVLNEAECDPPLEKSELEKIVHSVWGYRKKGCLTMGTAGANITNEGLRSFPAKPYEWQLFCWIIAHHPGRRTEFALAQQALAESLQWHKNTVRSVISRMIQQGLIDRIHTGKGTGDPHIYKLTDRAHQMYLIKTPLSPL